MTGSNYYEFEARLAEFDLDANRANWQKQMAFIELLQKWNKAYNLTAIRDPQQMIILHILDSLAVYPHLQGDNILDVGAGAGIPGIPLALCYPDKKFTLLDGNGKKTRFIQQAKIELGLSNVEVIHGRVEACSVENKFDCIISRAFATIATFITLSKGLLINGGQFLAMKGCDPDKEIAEIDDDFFCQEVVSLAVPGLDAERNLVRILARKK
ncbi:MAG: 16S rRNA (guanine(527)-N(7))-methyltransferase RsmG [Gammaproteobacteria bacterium]|nr:MAG: 16S rRNA (guanine(527)-N(7))-methyltransferase RsmG [Gammaproteobacteria bacterium]